MHFQKVLQGLPLIASEGDLGCDVTRVVYDSRNVQPGDLFVALRGITPTAISLSNRLSRRERLPLS